MCSTTFLWLKLKLWKLNWILIFSFSFSFSFTFFVDVTVFDTKFIHLEQACKWHNLKTSKMDMNQSLTYSRKGLTRYRNVKCRSICIFATVCTMILHQRTLLKITLLSILLCNTIECNKAQPRNNQILMNLRTSMNIYATPWTFFAIPYTTDGGRKCLLVLQLNNNSQSILLI